MHALLDGGTYNGINLLEQITRVRALDRGQNDSTNAPTTIMTPGEQIATNDKLQQERNWLAYRFAQELTHELGKTN